MFHHTLVIFATAAQEVSMTSRREAKRWGDDPTPCAGLPPADPSMGRGARRLAIAVAAVHQASATDRRKAQGVG